MKRPDSDAPEWPGMVAMLDALPVAAAIAWGAEGARVHVNRRFLELFPGAPEASEMTRDEYEARIFSRVDSSERSRLESMVKRLDEDTRAMGALALRLSDPSSARVSLWSVPVEDSRARVVGRLTLHRELGPPVREEPRAPGEPESELEHVHRELESAQAALLRSEKMASLGQLVAGVAHEINTPVGSIHSNGDLMVKAVSRLRELLESEGGLGERPELARTVDVLDDIGRVNRTACDRIVELVRSLRNFARSEETERRRVDLHEGLESTLTLVHHELKNRVEVVRDYGELPLVECAPSQLNQVFMNLLVNASQAIEGEGTVRIRTRHEGDRVLVEISDDGVGIAPENLDRIFEPGFTTKDPGEGTGIGLAICSRIVAAHGGDIDVRSTPGQGTTFVVSLPVGAPPEPELARGSAPGAGGPEIPGDARPSKER